MARLAAVILWLLAAGREVRIIEVRIIVDRRHALDAFAGCEFVDDQIRRQD